MESAPSSRPYSALSNRSGPSSATQDANSPRIPEQQERNEQAASTEGNPTISAGMERPREARRDRTQGPTRIDTDKRRTSAGLDRRDTVRELAEWALGVIGSQTSSSRYSKSEEAIIQMRRGLTSRGPSSSSSKVEALEALFKQLERLRTSSDSSKQLQTLLNLIPVSSTSSSTITTHVPRPASRSHHRSETRPATADAALAVPSRPSRTGLGGPSRSEIQKTSRDDERAEGSNGVDGKAAVYLTGQQDAVPISRAGPAPESEREKVDYKGKTKAEILAGWRKSKGTAPTETTLLLRDMLYLLQGIDGQHIRFARKTQSQKNAEANPYLVEPDFDDFGFGAGAKSGGKGKEKERSGMEGRGAVVQEWMKEEDITGVEFVGEDGKLCSVSPSMQHTIMDLAESGMLYRSVYNFVQRKQAEAGPSGNKASMIEQSLCHFLEHELSGYHALLAELERQMGSEISQLPPVDPVPVAGPSSRAGIGGSVFESDLPAQESEMTFQRLKLWSEEALLKLRVMSTLVDAAQHYRGGKLIAVIHDLTSHGDPFIRDMIKRVLAEVSKPFFHSLQAWIFSGELADPFNEFFVQLNPEAKKKLGRSHGYRGDMEGSDGAGLAYMIWDKKYMFMKEMLPGFVTEGFGKKIFSTGKSINFIRHSCHDSEWTSIQAQFTQVGQSVALEHSDIGTLERTIDDAYKVASKRLLEIFIDDYKLVTHLVALKNYVLLCAGDFADTLLQFVGPRLNKEASKLLRHHLTGDLENAIQGSLAKNEPDDVSRRIDASVETFQPGDLGWDAFALKYSVEAPINAVLDKRATEDYDQLFGYLWNVRRTSQALGAHWLKNTFGFRRLRTSKGPLTQLWHRSHILQGQMVHFMAELKAYCELEGIELAWEKLMQYIQLREGDLNDLIGAHRSYLESVKDHVLMLRRKTGKEKGGEEDSLMILAQEIMALIMGFQELMETLHRISTNEALQRDREKDAERGLTSLAATTYNPEKALEDQARLTRQIKRCGESFHAKLTELVAGLEDHPSNEVKFLAVRVSFNEHYKPVRRLKAKSSSKSLRNQTQATMTANLTTIAAT